MTPSRELLAQLEEDIDHWGCAQGDQSQRTEPNSSPPQKHSRGIRYPNDQQAATPAALRLQSIVSEENNLNNSLESWIQQRIDDPNTPFPEEDPVGTGRIKQAREGSKLTKSDCRVIGSGLTTQLSHDVDQYVTSAELLSGLATQPGSGLPKFIEDTFEAFFMRWGYPNLRETYMFARAFRLRKSAIETFFLRKLGITVRSRTARQMLLVKCCYLDLERRGKMRQNMLRTLEQEIEWVRQQREQRDPEHIDVLIDGMD